MKYILLSTIMLIGLTAYAHASDGPPTSGSAALLCKMTRHAETTAETIAIDYEKKQVNGIEATFTPSAIIWIVKNGDATEHHELNRITGTYTYWRENGTPGEPLPAFTCEKAPVKF